MTNFTDIPDCLIYKNSVNIGDKVYMKLLNKNSFNINDLVLVTIEEIIDDSDENSDGIIILGKEEYINNKNELKHAFYIGNAIYLYLSNFLLLTADGPKIIRDTIINNHIYKSIVDYNSIKNKYIISCIFCDELNNLYEVNLCDNYFFDTLEEVNSYLDKLNIEKILLSNIGITCNLGENLYTFKDYNLIIKNNYANNMKNYIFEELCYKTKSFSGKYNFEKKFSLKICSYDIIKIC